MNPLTARPYAGLTHARALETFTADTPPTKQTHGDRYTHIAGPFINHAAALHYVLSGGNVDPAECNRLHNRKVAT